MEKRTCCKCSYEYSLTKEFFHRDSSQKEGFNYMCKSCSNARHKEYRDSNKEKWRITQRNSAIKVKFGLSPEDYTAKLEDQGGVCYICRKPEVSTWKGKVKHLAVDHCHKSGKIRDLLCVKCNKALGLVDDNIDLLKECIKYLQKHKIKEIG